MLSIRKGSIEDLNQLSQLFNQYRQFYEQASDLPLATQFIAERISKQESVIFVAENNEGELIGFCQIYPSFCSVIAAKVGILYDLFVDSTARKTGAGRALMLAAHEYAVQSGLARLDLSTAKNNYTAQALYESLGWKRDEVFYTYNLDM